MSTIERSLNCEELQRFCDALKEADALCDECRKTLKLMVYYAMVGEPSIRDQATDREYEGNVTIHASCITRLLEMFLGYFKQATHSTTT